MEEKINTWKNNIFKTTEINYVSHTTPFVIRGLLINLTSGIIEGNGYCLWCWQIARGRQELPLLSWENMWCCHSNRYFKPRSSLKKDCGLGNSGMLRRQGPIALLRLDGVLSTVVSKIWQFQRWCCTWNLLSAGSVLTLQIRTSQCSFSGHNEEDHGYVSC